MKKINAATILKIILNLLILIKDALIIFLRYFTYIITGALILTVSKSQQQILDVVETFESLFGTLFILGIVTTPVMMIFLNILLPSQVKGNLKKFFNMLISKRRSVILWGILTLFHSYSNGMENLGQVSPQYIWENYSTQCLQLILVLLLLSYLTSIGKEQYLDYLISTTNTTKFQNIESTFTAYGKDNIITFASGAEGYLNSPIMKGEASFKIKSLLTPIKINFILEQPERLYQYEMSFYLRTLFTLHKIVMFFKGMVLAIKYKSSSEIRSVIKNEGSVMTKGQSLIYDLILLVVVCFMFNYLYIWLTR